MTMRGSRSYVFVPFISGMKVVIGGSKTSTGPLSVKNFIVIHLEDEVHRLHCSRTAKVHNVV